MLPKKYDRTNTNQRYRVFRKYFPILWLGKSNLCMLANKQSELGKWVRIVVNTCAVSSEDFLYRKRTKTCAQ